MKPESEKQNGQKIDRCQLGVSDGTHHAGKIDLTKTLTPEEKFEIITRNLQVIIHLAHKR